MCSWLPRSSRWASTCRTQPSWSSMDADRFGCLAAAPAAWPGGPGLRRGLCLLVTETEPAVRPRALGCGRGDWRRLSLSRLDLEQRREGDVLGAAQAGRRSSLKLLSLLADEELIGKAREEAAAVVAGDPELAATRGFPPRSAICSARSGRVSRQDLSRLAQGRFSGRLADEPKMRRLGKFIAILHMVGYGCHDLHAG